MVEFKPIPDYADVMSVEDWTNCVRVGAFIPDDGDGYWCKNDKYESNLSCWKPRPDWATHVAWYNR